jgi:hypothetical protein
VQENRLFDVQEHRTGGFLCRHQWNQKESDKAGTDRECSRIREQEQRRFPPILQALKEGAAGTGGGIR